MSDDQHIEPELHLYAIMHVLAGRAPPPEQGEGARPELARLMRELDQERFRRPPPVAFKLKQKDVDRFVEHAERCTPCQVVLFEDGPGASPPRSDEEKALEVSESEKGRRKKVINFWIHLVVGTVGFVGSQLIVYWIRSRAPTPDEAGPALELDPSQLDRQIDPLWYLFAVVLLVTSYGLATAYTIARELWIDFTAWKRAVPVIGKRWAEASKKKEEELKRSTLPLDRPKKWKKKSS